MKDYILSTKFSVWLTAYLYKPAVRAHAAFGLDHIVLVSERERRAIWHLYTEIFSLSSPPKYKTKQIRSLNCTAFGGHKGAYFISSVLDLVSNAEFLLFSCVVNSYWWVCSSIFSHLKLFLKKILIFAMNFLCTN